MFKLETYEQNVSTETGQKEFEFERAHSTLYVLWNKEHIHD